MNLTTLLIVMVGLCGGYSTFSASSLQALDLLRAGAYGRAGVNFGLSVLLCFAAVTAGHLLGAQLSGHAVRVAQVAAEEEA